MVKTKQFTVVLTSVVIVSLAIVLYKTIFPGDPNIVLITIDALRADRVGCYGYKINTTPNIDAFSTEAVMFENAYTPAPNTLFAVRAIMTGRLLSNIDGKELVSYYSKATFLAEILREKGYQTAGFTDHHGLGKKGTKKGLRLLRGFDTFVNIGEGATGTTSRLLTNKIVSWLKDNHNKKFFLWAHYFDPHLDYNPLPEYEGLFGFKEGDHGRIYNGIAEREIKELYGSITEREVGGLVSLQNAEIFYTDEYVGKVLDEIKNLDLGKNTIIIITADHGEEIMDRKKIGHSTSVYNEQIRVPLIIKAPGETPARINKNISTIEIFNYLTEVGAVAMGEGSKDVISRTARYPRLRINKRSPSQYFAIISGKYKYIHNPDAEKEELYDLRADIGEKANLADDPDYADTKELLNVKLTTWIKENKATVTPPSKEALESEKELNDRLRSLGYAV